MGDFFMFIGSIVYILEGIFIMMGRCCFGVKQEIVSSKVKLQVSRRSQGRLGADRSR